MSAILEYIDWIGKSFVGFAGPMLVQASVLIVILLIVDLAIRKRVRAVFRYCIWMLVVVKLVLPVSLSSPVSVGYWFGEELTRASKSGESANVTANQTQRMIAVQSEVGLYGKLDAAGNEIKSAEWPRTFMPIENEPAAVGVATPPVSSTAPVSWQGLLFLVWLAVVIVMGLLLLQRAIFVNGLVRQARSANGLMNDTLTYCRNRMGMKGKFNLKVSANATSPAVCGLFRPAILVPQDLASGLGPGHLRAVLLHELAHIKRGDLWVNLVQTLLQIIYFYNPLLWLANAMIRRVREQAVDEAVQVAMGEKARQYPQTLVDVARLAFKRPALSLRLIGVVESKSALKGRIKRMLNRPIPKSAKLGVVGLILVLIFGVVLLPMAKAASKPPEFVIKGIVTDVETGQPISGAKVGDNKEYNDGKFYTFTDSNGYYEYKTWYEEHGITVEVSGYKPADKGLYTKLFASEKEKVIDFELTPEKDSLIPKQDESPKDLFGITDALAVSDRSGQLTIKSIHVTGLDGKKSSSNKTSILVDVVNNSDREVNLGLEYYTDSGTIAWVFSPGASAMAKVLKVRPNWQGQLEFPMNYNRFAKGGYVKITLAKCSSERIEGVSLPQGVEVIHEKKYSVISASQQKQAVKLLKTLRTAKGRKQLATAEKLAKYGRSVVPALIEMLQDDEVWAAYALGEIGPEAEDAVPALIKSLTQGGVGGVRTFSATALGQIGPAAVQAIPALIGALKDKNGNTRMHAAGALGFLSTGGKEVIGALTAILQDEDETVRKEAARSLKQIEDKSEKKSGVVGVQDNTSAKSTSAEAAFIIQKVLDRYAAMKTYSAIGEMQVEVHRPLDAMGAMSAMTVEQLQQMRGQKLKSTFTIKMARPNLYCIEWNENVDTSLSKVGNVWSVGDGSYGLIHGKEKSFKKALRALIATAGSMGKVQSSLFFDTSLNKLRELRQLSQKSDEKMEGIDCYVISGNLHSRTYTYWVSKGDFLIRRHQHIPGGDGKPIEQPEPSEETIKEALKAMDEEATPEAIAKLKKTLNAARAMASKVKVTKTETYRSIIVDQPISKEQFVPRRDIDAMAEELKKQRVEYTHRLKKLSLTDPNFKTDVQIEVEKLAGEGESTENEEQVLEGLTKKRKVYLPDADTPEANVILDLASGELLPAGTGEEQLTIFRKMGKGDLAYDRFLICIRGGKAKLWEQNKLSELKVEGQIEDLTAYQLGNLPCRLLVTTAEGDSYDVTILSADDSGVSLEYQKTDVQVEGENVGSKLEFRIVPNHAPSGQGPSIEPIVLKDYMDTLIAKGPDDEIWRNSAHYSKYKWLQYNDNTKDVGVTVRHKGKRFGLLCNEPEFTMLANQQWGLQKVYPERDPMNRPALQFEFDTKGSELFYELTSNNLKNRLAIIIDDKIYSVPQIMSAIRPRGAITGIFTEGEVEALVEELQKGMPPVVPRTEGQQPGFEPTIEITVNDNVAVGKNSNIDFDTGRLFSRLENWRQLSADDWQRWIEKTGVDASGATRSSVRGLMCDGMIITPMNNTYWNNVRANSLETNNLWEIGKPGRPAYMIAQGQLPVTYMFKTREGGIGVLQITGFNDEPRGIKIRYKMIEKSAVRAEREKMSKRVADTSDELLDATNQNAIKVVREFISAVKAEKYEIANRYLWPKSEVKDVWPGSEKIKDLPLLSKIEDFKNVTIPDQPLSVVVKHPERGVCEAFLLSSEFKSNDGETGQLFFTLVDAAFFHPEIYEPGHWVIKQLTLTDFKLPMPPDIQKQSDELASKMQQLIPYINSYTKEHDGDLPDELFMLDDYGLNGYELFGGPVWWHKISNNGKGKNQNLADPSIIIVASVNAGSKRCDFYAWPILFLDGHIEIRTTLFREDFEYGLKEASLQKTGFHVLAEKLAGQDEKSAKLAVQVEGKDEKVIAVVHGNKILSRDIEPSTEEIEKNRSKMGNEQFYKWHKQYKESRLRELIFQPLFKEYAELNGFDATEAEIEEYFLAMNRLMVKQDAEWQQARDNLAKELESPDISDTRKEEIESQMKIVDRLLESRKERVLNTKYKELPRVVIKAWKVNKSLFEKYSGRVIFQQGGPEPLDAYKAFLQEQESAGRFEIRDKQIADLFWNYFINDDMHNFYSDVNEAKRLMEKPWWLTKPAGDTQKSTIQNKGEKIN